MPETRRVFVDVLTLREDRTAAEAEAYFQAAIPVIERHGLRRTNVIEVKSKMRGHDQVNPDIVQIWQVEADNPFAGLATDPDYQALVARRDSIFDMTSLQGWFGAMR